MSKPKRPVSIDGVEFDALITASETMSADVPDYPCEEGYSVHDTKIQKPMELSLTLFLSRNPVTWYNRLGKDKNRVNVVCEKLRKMFADSDVVTVLTPTDKYKNMAITSVGIEKSKENGDGRGISITLKQVHFTKTKTVTVPAQYALAGATKANAGTASTSKPSSGSSGSSSGSGSGGGSHGGSNGGNSGSENKASLLYKAASGLGLM